MLTNGLNAADRHFYRIRELPMNTWKYEIARLDQDEVLWRTTNGVPFMVHQVVTARLRLEYKRRQAWSRDYENNEVS